MRRLVTAALAAVLALRLARPGRAARRRRPAKQGAGRSGASSAGAAPSASAPASRLPLVPQGLIHDPGFRVRDSLDLDLGIDYLSYWNHHYVAPTTTTSARSTCTPA